MGTPVPVSCLVRRVAGRGRNLARPFPEPPHPRAPRRKNAE